MKEIIELNQIIPLLPATTREIAVYFPNASFRGLRNKLNRWVKEGKIYRFTYSNGKQGQPQIVYSVDSSSPNCEDLDRLLKVQKDLADGIRLSNRQKLISAYKKLGDILLEN